MNRFSVFIFLMLTKFLYAQDLNSFNSIYNKTYLQTSQSDMKKALTVADSLYMISETPVLKVRSLMLSATLYHQSGDLKNAIKFAKKAEEAILTTDNNGWKGRIYGFLATQHRILRFYSDFKIYIQMAQEVSEKIEDSKKANDMKGLLMQEMAYYEQDQGNYKKSNEYVNKSQSYFDTSSSNIETASYRLGNNEQLLGLNYYKLKDSDKSKLHYENALKALEKIPVNVVTCLSYDGLAIIYMDRNNLGEAKKYIDLMEDFSDKSVDPALKNSMYATSQRYYELIRDVDKVSDLAKKKDSVKGYMIDKSYNIINESYSSLKKENTVIKKESNVNKYLIFLSCLLLIGSIIYLVIYRRKQKIVIERFKRVLKKSDERKWDLVDFANNTATVISELENTESIQIVPEEVSETKLSDNKAVIMTQETEKKIMSKLNEFEKSTIFTQKNLSLPYLATYCNTNNRYLSHVINTHKKKDFYNYINELKIAYIIEKLKNNPEYRKFKIASLADECGFSSPNKFTLVFKKETEILPSLFIKFLNQEDKL